LNRITASEHTSFFSELLQTALRMLVGERGFLLRIDDDGSWTVEYALRRDGVVFHRVDTLPFPKLVERIIAKGTPGLDGFIDEGGQTTDADGQPAPVRSAVGVPLQLDDQTRGLIYIDCDRTAQRFDRRHLELLSTLAQLAGVVKSQVALSTGTTPVVEEQQPEQLQSFIDSVPSPLLIIDAKGEPVLCNRAYQEHSVFSNPQYTEAWQALCRELASRTAATSVTTTNAASVADDYLPTEVEFAARHYRLSTFPTGQTNRGVIIHELTQRTMAQRGRGLSQQDQELVSRLAGGIAHEIKNALTPTVGRLQLLASSLNRYPLETSVQSRRQIDLIHRQLGKISRIAAHLSDLSRPQRIETKPLRLSELMEATLELLTETDGAISSFTRVPGEDSDFFLTTDYSPATPIINGDQDLLQQMLTNLLINAMHAVEEKTAGAISITVYPVSDGAQITIADTGSGIDPRLQKRIWDPWFTTKSRERGSGLGMMVVKTIVDSHQARIWLESWPGAGTQVHIHFPSVSG